MRQMTTVYLDDEHMKFFETYKDASMSHVIRQLLTKFIEVHHRKIERKNLKVSNVQKIEEKVEPVVN